MEIPSGYVGRGRVQGSAWQSPNEIQAARKKKEQDDAAKTVPFEEFKSSNGKSTIFRQLPFSESTHKTATVYIEIYDGKIEKVIIYFLKQLTCNEFCDLVRRQILNGIFKSYELELFLADDDGKFDDQNEPPPSNEILAKIIDIGLDSFYFKITNSWQLSETDKMNIINKINNHKNGLFEYQGSLGDDDDDDDDDSDDNDDNAVQQNNGHYKKSNDGASNGGNGCCIIL